MVLVWRQRFFTSLEETQDYFVAKRVSDVGVESLGVGARVVLLGVLYFVRDIFLFGFDGFLAGDIGEDEAHLRAFVGSFFPGTSDFFTRFLLRCKEGFKRLAHLLEVALETSLHIVELIVE